MSWLMVVDFEKGRLVKMVRLEAKLGLYIIVAEVGRVYGPALGEFGWFLSVSSP